MAAYLGYNLRMKRIREEEEFTSKCLVNSVRDMLSTGQSQLITSYELVWDIFLACLSIKLREL